MRVLSGSELFATLLLVMIELTQAKLTRTANTAKSALNKEATVIQRMTYDVFSSRKVDNLSSNQSLFEHR
jgi:hypothetical protein